MKKTAVVVFADPRSKSEEALGRLFNALFLTYELKQKNEDVTLIFQGAGTHWAGEVVKTDHPAHALYAAVEDKVVACGGCADVFGATHAAEAAGQTLLREVQIPGTTGVVDLSKYVVDGAHLVTF